LSVLTVAIMYADIPVMYYISSIGLITFFTGVVIFLEFTNIFVRLS